jgi:predicted DNA-binding transcriptional regulator AlpA
MHALTSAKCYVARAKLCQWFGVQSRTLQNWEGKNGFPRSLKIGGRDYYVQEEIDQYLARQQKASEA